MSTTPNFILVTVLSVATRSVRPVYWHPSWHRWNVRRRPTTSFATGERLSYRATAERADAMAAQLRHQGVEPGDRVGLLVATAAN
jgi:acyl-CoA synthetase (AMP-forming)/AMP-acid ligase II